MAVLRAVTSPTIAGRLWAGYSLCASFSFSENEVGLAVLWGLGFSQDSVVLF